MPKDKKKKAKKAKGSINQEVHVNVKINSDNKPRKRAGRAAKGAQKQTYGNITPLNIQFPGFSNMHGISEGHHIGMLSRQIEDLRTNLGRIQNDTQQRSLYTPERTHQTRETTPIQNSVRGGSPPDSNFYGAQANNYNPNQMNHDSTMLSEIVPSPPQPPQPPSYGNMYDDETMYSPSPINAGVPPPRTPPSSRGGMGVPLQGGTNLSYMGSPDQIGSINMSPIRQETPLSVEEIDSYPTPPEEKPRTFGSIAKRVGSRLLDLSKRFNDGMDKEAARTIAMDTSQNDSQIAQFSGQSPLRSEFPGFQNFTVPAPVRQQNLLEGSPVMSSHSNDNSVMHVDSSGSIHNEPEFSVMHVDKSGVGHNKKEFSVMHADESGSVHDTPAPEQEPSFASMQSEPVAESPLPSPANETREDKRKRLRMNSIIHEYKRLQFDVNPSLFSADFDPEKASQKELLDEVNKIRRATGQYKKSNGHYNPFSPYELDDPLEDPRSERKLKKRGGVSFTPTAPDTAGPSRQTQAPRTPGFTPIVIPRPNPKRTKK